MLTEFTIGSNDWYHRWNSEVPPNYLGDDLNSVLIFKIFISLGCNKEIIGKIHRCIAHFDCGNCNMLGIILFSCHLYVHFSGSDHLVYYPQVVALQQKSSAGWRKRQALLLKNWSLQKKSRLLLKKVTSFILFKLGPDLESI